MPPDRPAPAVVLLAPALDAASATSSAGLPPDGPSPDGSPPDGPGDAADPLERAVAAAGGAFVRSSVEALPWEVRLMSRVGLLDPSVARADALSAVPAARLLGEADLADASGAERLVVADPVSLSPGRDEATLEPPESLALTEAETDAFVAAANALLADDGIGLARGASGRWYLRGLDGRALATPPTHFLARREIGAYLPASAAAAPWRRLMTELQMLWHAHPVNEERLARGAPPVNGVWFWGAAPLPDVAGSSAAATVVTDDPLARALARHAAATLAAEATFDAALAACADATLLIVDLGPYAAWLANDAEALEAARAATLERWLVPATRAVLDGRAAALVVAGDDAGEARFVPPPRRSWLARLFGARTARAS